MLNRNLVGGYNVRLLAPFDGTAFLHAIGSVGGKCNGGTDDNQSGRHCISRRRNTCDGSAADLVACIQHGGWPGRGGWKQERDVGSTRLAVGRPGSEYRIEPGKHDLHRRVPAGRWGEDGVLDGADDLSGHGSGDTDDAGIDVVGYADGVAAICGYGGVAEGQ